MGKTLLKASAIDFQGRDPVPQETPVAVVLLLEIKEECVNEFVNVMTANAVGSRSELGCLRFDFLRDEENPCKFITYEVFASPEALDIHKEMPYVKDWGALQYGEMKPVISKTLLKADAIDFQFARQDASETSTLVHAPRKTVSVMQNSPLADQDATES